MSVAHDIVFCAEFNPCENAALQLWSAASPLVKEHWGGECLSISGVELLEDEVVEFVSETGADRFTLEASGRPVYTCGESYRTHQYGVTIRFRAHLAPSLLGSFLDSCVGLPISARIFSRSYSNWQNETYVSDYEKEGWPFDELQIYIDRRKKRRVPIDNNPGREVEHRGDLGYDEAVGSTMWVGPSFAQRTGGDWRDMKRYDWCQITKHDNGLVRLESWPEPFDSDQGEQRERQEVLRRVLFPQSIAT